MTDERLNELLDDAARTYRVPPDPDLAAMWAEIEKDAFVDHPRWHAWTRSPSWRLVGLGMAATLVLGVGIGRLTRQAAPTVAATTTANTSTRAIPAAYDRTATELLGRTAVLLTALPANGEASAQTNARFASQARELLTTARLLLDSPAASDQRFKELLQDLELVLAQIARLQPGRGNDMEWITDALEERDVVPRIRSAVARLSLGDD